MEGITHMNELAKNEQRTDEITGQLANFGGSGKVAVVHKADHEGIIEIDPFTGHVLTLLSERPEWAEELTVAQVAERHGFYSQALGSAYTDELKVPEAFAFEDLGWLGARPLPEDHDADTAAHQDPNYDGFEHYEVEADQEFRSNFIAELQGIKGDIEAMETELVEGTAFGLGTITAGTDGSLTVDLTEAMNADNFRTQEEIEEQAKQRASGFSKVASGS